MIWISTLLIAMQSHAFHVSVTDVKFKEDKKAIQISSRIFLDDLELALQDYSGNTKLDILDEAQWETVDSLLSVYLLANFKISNAKGQYQINYVGAEREAEVMWCYLEIEKVKKLKEVTIWNNLLISSFPDQENLIHFNAYNKTKSGRCLKGAESKQFSWGD